MCLLRSPDLISYVVVAAIYLCPDSQQNKGVVNVELGLSLGEKRKTINWCQNPEKTLRLWNGALESNKQSTSTEREERERVGETRDRDRRKRCWSKSFVAVGRRQALVSWNLIPGKTTETKP
jgi:hypothetical protein